MCRDTLQSWSRLLCSVSTVDLNFLFLMLSADFLIFFLCRSAVGSVAFHHVTPALCCDIQQSPHLPNHRRSITSEALHLPFTALFSRALSFCFRYWWVCFSSPSPSTVYLSFQHLAVIFAFSEDSVWGLLLSLARQLINADKTAGMPRSLTERTPATPQAPSLLLEPHLSLAVWPLLYLPEW